MDVADFRDTGSEFQYFGPLFIRAFALQDLCAVVLYKL